MVEKGAQQVDGAQGVKRQRLEIPDVTTLGAQSSVKSSPSMSGNILNFRSTVIPDVPGIKGTRLRLGDGGARVNGLM